MTSTKNTPLVCLNCPYVCYRRKQLSSHVVQCQLKMEKRKKLLADYCTKIEKADKIDGVTQTDSEVKESIRNSIHDMNADDNEEEAVFLMHILMKKN